MGKLDYKQRIRYAQGEKVLKAIREKQIIERDGEKITLRGMVQA